MPDLDLNLHRDFVRALGRLPVTATPEGRESLLVGIPSNIISSLERSSAPTVHLNNIIRDLDRLGRIEATGERPLVIIAENALDMTRGSTLGQDFKDIMSRLKSHYSGTEAPSKNLEPLAAEEILIGGQDERVPYYFIQQALDAAGGVARLQVPRFLNGKETGDHVFGTGWLVAPGMLMTNYHVIEARDKRFEPPATEDDIKTQAENTVAWFDYHREGGDKKEVHGTELLCAFYDDETAGNLDYCLLRLKDDSTVEDRTPIPIVRERIEYEEGARLNILQHPKGGALRYAIRNNFFVKASKNGDHLSYITDTEPGSSGSPVFDDTWHVVAMHHKYQDVSKEVYRGEIIKFHNQGVNIHAILDHLPRQIREEVVIGQRWG